MLFKFQGITAHVREVAEFAAKVLCVSLAIRGLPTDSNERATQRHLLIGRKEKDIKEGIKIYI